jgi:hypothetical protein
LRQTDVLRLVALVLPLWLAGCCGGYAVVQTRLSSVPPSRDGADPGGQLLHYSRVGEPPNACGSNQKYTEDLYVRVPSIRAGETHTIGARGVTAAYTRDRGARPETTKRVAGKVTIVELRPGALVAALDVTITLDSGEAVTLDDEYAFHSQR